MVKHRNKLPREVVGSLHPWSHSKSDGMQRWTTYSSLPCFEQGWVWTRWSPKVLSILNGAVILWRDQQGWCTLKTLFLLHCYSVSRWCRQELQGHFERSDKTSFDQPTKKKTEKKNMPVNVIPNVLISDIASLARGDLNKKKIDFLFWSMGFRL